MPAIVTVRPSETLQVLILHFSEMEAVAILCRIGRSLSGKGTWKEQIFTFLAGDDIIVQQLKFVERFTIFKAFFLTLFHLIFKIFLFCVTGAKFLNSQKLSSLICKKGIIPFTSQNCFEDKKGRVHACKVFSLMPAVKYH